MDLEREDTRAALLRLCEVMRSASLCAFGQLTPEPVRELIERFGDRIFSRPSDDN